MKLVVWNMHDAGRAYSKPRHADAWRYLHDLNTDFALLQEARLPADAAEVWQGGRPAPKPKPTPDRKDVVGKFA